MLGRVSGPTGVRILQGRPQLQGALSIGKSIILFVGRYGRITEHLPVVPGDALPLMPPHPTLCPEPGIVFKITGEIHKRNHFKVPMSVNSVHLWCCATTKHIKPPECVFITPKENLTLLNSLSSFSPPPAPGIHQRAFYIYGFTYSGYFI